MREPITFFGHRPHVVFVPLPLGLLMGAVAFDLIALFTDRWSLAQAAAPMTAAGILSAIPAAASGFLDWLRITAVTRAKRVGLVHMTANLTAVGIFAVSWLLRDGDGRATPAVLVTSVIGLGVLSFGGWLGGELVEKFGVGIAEGASLNAPGSLQGWRRRRQLRRGQQ